jgi:hypothetical protein
MEMDVDTFLVSVYCVVDDLYQARYAARKPVRPGRKATLSDSEVLTLALLQQWRSDRAERGFVRWVRAHWRHYFPHMLGQSSFNRRVRDLTGVLERLGPDVSAALAHQLGEDPRYTVLDGVPVPLMRRCRGARHRCFGAEAGMGRGGSDHSWYYGCLLLDAVCPHGTVTGFVVGPAATQERWLAETLLRWRQDPSAPPPTLEENASIVGRRHRAAAIGPTGPLHGRLSAGAASSYYLGDAGFAGSTWQQHWRQTYGAYVLTHADPPVAALPGIRASYAAARQVVETVHSILLGTFGLAFPRARTAWGLRARLAAKIAAFNLAVLLNYQAGRPPFSIFNPLD